MKRQRCGERQSRNRTGKADRKIEDRKMGYVFIFLSSIFLSFHVLLQPLTSCQLPRSLRTTWTIAVQSGVAATEVITAEYAEYAEYAERQAGGFGIPRIPRIPRFISFGELLRGLRAAPDGAWSPWRTGSVLI
jgi:hypothetical protein